MHPLIGHYNTSSRHRQRHLSQLLLSYLCPGVDNTAHEADKDGRDAPEGDRRVEEDEPADGDRELVERPDHGVGGRRRGPLAPGTRVRDGDGAEAGVDHADDQGAARVLGEVPGEVGWGPVLD